MSELKNLRVLITGGLGMIGSTVAHKLIQNGAEVTIADVLLEPFGANWFNLEGIKNKVTVTITDIRDKKAIMHLVKDKDLIFNFAAQVGHNDSIENPLLDADINYIGHLNLAECVKKCNPDARIIFSGSRVQYGKIQSIPVTEDHPSMPISPHALHKTAAENMYKFYYNIFGISCVLFRIANPYGPRSQMKHSKYSMVNWFIRQAMEGNTIKIFGDGEQLRDYIYVEDLADALIKAAMKAETSGEVFNIGSGKGTKFKDMVKNILEIVGSGNMEFSEWPENYINVETGDYISDISKITNVIEWKPKTSLKEGIQKTYTYYKKYREHYW